MIIKKFQGKTELEAVNNAKAELGENVVIMHVRQTKPKGLFSFLRRKVYEVSAAVEEEQDTNYGKIAEAVSAIREVVPKEPEYTPYKAPAKPVIEEPPVKAPVENIPSNNIEEKLESLHTLLEKQLVKEEPESIKKDDSKNTDFFKLIYNTLIDNEVDEKYVNNIIDGAASLNKPNATIDYILANIYQKMILKFGKTSVIKEGTNGPKIVFFVGTTGVGKTTTIAKIASKLSLNDKKKVTLLTTDTYRIAAAEQLRTYANILENPFRVIYTTDELVAALKDFSTSDFILIDTAGHSQNNENQKNGMKQFLDCVDESYEKEVYLVLSATTKYRDLISVCDTYSEFTKYKIIFTKLDETSTLGNIYNVRLHTGAEMSYVTCGQNVPDDIEEFSPQSTVKQLLGGK
ncbi:MAG: flagellar biosynthesis protein FlhF [Lachnospiraceae bacterium]|nr:flagellar biosynthesis protein FlhF [Lachnospiraceae bacterium]